MQFRRMQQPTDAAIRTTVRSIESYRDRRLELRASSVGGSAITLSILIDGRQCLEKVFTSSNEARVLDRGLRFGMNLIDALDAEGVEVRLGEVHLPHRHESSGAAAVRTSF